MEKITIDGIEYDVYTMEDWRKDGSLKVEEGQAIEPEVFWDLCEALPPHRWGKGVFQPGEPWDHDMQTGKALYQTFEKLNSDDYYKYIGLRN